MWQLGTPETLMGFTALTHWKNWSISPKRTASLVYNVAANSHVDATVRAIMEKHVPTKELRCPFAVPLGYVQAGQQMCDDDPDIKR